MRFNSFFSGIGGIDCALEATGHERVFSCEIADFPRRVHAARFGQLPEACDILDLQPRDVPHAQLWTAGFPCTDLSIAGRRAGIHAARSGLVWKFLSLAQTRWPERILLENVPGLLSSHKGNDFSLLLAELARIGYAGEWRTLDAQHFGVPQRRRRVFVHAWRSRGDREAITNEIPETSRRWAWRLDKPALGAWLTSGRWTTKGSVETFDDLEHFGRPKLTRLVDILEAEVDPKYLLSKKACRGVLRRAEKRGRTLPDDLDYALRVAAGLKPRAAGLKPRAAGLANALNQKGNRQDASVETFVTLQSHHKRNCPDDPMCVVPVDFAQLTHPENRTRSRAGDHASSLTAESKKGVALGFGNFDADMFATKDRSAALRIGVSVSVAHGMQVRRLTPRECERLQAFPDDWTLIEGAKDSPRYKALGNAVCVLVLRAIGRRLK